MVQTLDARWVWTVVNNRRINPTVVGIVFRVTARPLDTQILLGRDGEVESYFGI